MPFGLKNAGATYQRAMVTLFHDMMHKEIEVYVDDMIAKSRTECASPEETILKAKEVPTKAQSRKVYFRSLVRKTVGIRGRLNYIARFISQLTEKCDSIFRLLRKHNPGVWDEECQKTFDKVKHYLSNAPVLMPHCPDKPLILYLTVFENSMGCMLGQHDETGRKEKAIYYLSKKFTECETSRALEDYEPLNFDFPNEDLMYVATTEEESQEGNGIGAVFISPNGDHYPFTSKLDFDCTNNMAEYEACVMGIRTAIESKIKVLEEFDDVTFCYLPRDENQMADALAFLASMIKVNKQEDMKPIQMSIYEAPAHCCNVEEEEEKDDHPWYQDILRYVKSREYPNQATENDKRTLRRLTSDYVLDGEILYKRRKDQVLLRCVDAVEAKQIL
ncbi:hypothetical protein CXB51_022830 [Gossypium anomalum]|uniref:Reverse transcriptase/retrotransposon-derived protein RNase H-like domain-containing protein n=1 Tax=Gossypium anomalum TaxID=47600 RepID=A0A8J5Z9G0_9ROSI|nr:hypothetical protein CXB51_022830 [Gossypium anomalum]